MGLDLVEYVIAVEDAFEIEIPDADASRLETPAQLIDYLCARLGESPDGPPLIQTAFYWLRRAIMAELGVPRSEVRPSTTIVQLTDRPENEVWKAVANRLEVRGKLLTHHPIAKVLSALVRAPGRTIGDVSRRVAMLQPSAFNTAPATWTRSQITEVALRLLEHETGLTVGPSQLQSSFVRDLGMG